VNATIVSGLFALLGCFSESGVLATGGSWNPGGWLGSSLSSIFSIGVASTDIFDGFFFTLFTLCLVLLPFRRPEIYETSVIKVGGKIGVATIGFAGFAANLALDYMILTASQDSYNILSPTSDNWFAIGFSLLLTLIGACVYAYYRWGPTKKGTDYQTIFAQIPPE
jgi:hypothetical protein